MHLVKFYKTCYSLLGLFIFSLIISFSSRASTNIAGNQSGVWTKANSPYIITSTVTVTTGHTLNIQPGVTVIFANYSCDFVINGTLNAIGSVTDSIRFKGTYSAPYNTYYGGTLYLNTSTSALKYLRTDSMGYSNHALVIADQMTPTISNSTIKNDNRNLDIYTWIGGGKNFTNVNGIVYIKSATYSINATLAKLSGTGYYYLVNGVTMSAGTRLTIQPGVSILFPNYSVDLVVNGVLDAQGTSTDSIKIKGKYYTPANTFHGGTISINGDSSILNYVSIDSMGYYTSSIIIADNLTPTISNSSIRHTNTNDIYTWIGGGKNFLNLNAVVLVKPQTVGVNAFVSKIGGNSYYKFNGGVTISDGATLNVQAGAKIIFPHYSHSLVINGILNAQGSASDSIKFKGAYYPPTAASDHGGGIYLNKDSSVLNYVVIDSMGDASYVTAALTLGAYCTINNTTLKNSETWGIVIADNIKVSISNSVLQSNNYGDLYTWIGGVTNLTNFKGIPNIKASSVAVNTVMPKFNTSNPTYNLLGTITINNGSKLTIQPGNKLIFSNYTVSMVANGILDAQGTVSDSIRFYGHYSTSSSSHGGIIALYKDSSIINYAVIDSMGDSYYHNSAILISAKSTITNTVLKNTETTGIIISDNIQPVINNTIIKNSNNQDLNSWIGGVDNLNSFTGNVNIRGGNLNVNSKLPKYNTNNYYNLLGSITVNAGSKLTIKPGVSVGFPQMGTSLVVNGLLDAQGTVSDSIRFIGKSNPSNGSSTHGGIVHLNKEGSILDYVSLDSMGDSYYHASALLMSFNSTFRNSSIRNSESSGLVISDNIKPVLNNSSFKNSGAYDINTWLGGLDSANNMNTVHVGIRGGSLGVNGTFPKLLGNGAYYRLLGSVTINNGAKLTMKPGIRVLFPNFGTSMTVNGILDAQGTSADSIKLYGTNANSGQSTHGGGIYINKDSSRLSYVRIDSMGDSYYHNGSLIISDNITTSIVNSSITNSETADVYSWVGVGKYIDSLKGVITIRSYNIGSTETMYKVRGTYYRLAGTLTLNAGNTLTVQPGVTLVFPAANINFINNGILVAIGNKTDSIKFKGARNLPNATLYGGTVFINRDSSILKYVVVDSLGDAGGNYGGLYFSGGCLLQYCNIKNNKNAGMYIASSNVNASYTNITKNENGIIVYNSKPVLNNCNIFSNTNLGANNTYKVYSADATNCYWGNATGPYHPTLNPTGTANGVSDSIKFIPFKTASVVPVLPFITSFSPQAAATDTVIVIRGTRFTSTTSVTFGGKPAKSFTVLNDSTINAVVNTGSSGFVKVTKAAGADSVGGFTYCSGIALSTSFTFSTNYSVVNFNNTSVFATSYLWDFGDGTFATDSSPVHHYNNPGTYTACLTTKNVCARSVGNVCKVIPMVGIAFDDGDRDGLFDPTEAGLYGTSSSIFDSNNDGLADGVNVFTGFLVLSTDTDGDGISNLLEMINGTNPLLADTDFDGVPDNLDAFPKDRYRSKIPPPNAADLTAPVITLSEPN